MKYKDDVIAVVVGTLIIALFAVIVFFGYDFLAHIARHMDYPVWKVSVMYFTSVFIIVVSSILGNR